MLAFPIEVHLIFLVVKRVDLPQVIGHVQRLTPNAFYSVEDVRFVSKGVFPLKKSGEINGWSILRLVRKGK